MPTDVFGFLYAATVAAGGIVGFIKASSVPSLAAGLAFGGILGAGAFLNSQDPPRPLLQLSTSLLLAGMMGARWNKSGKFMPPGFICSLSIAAIIYNIAFYKNHLPILGKS